MPGNPVVGSMTATNPNMGMDLWNPSAGTGNMKMQPNQTVATPMLADQWVQVYKKVSDFLVCYSWVMISLPMLRQETMINFKHTSPSIETNVWSLYYPKDERELKRQKRKQSNRESARRSRLRKQVWFVR